MNTYEYRLLHLYFDSARLDNAGTGYRTDELNQLGEEGWEAVSAVAPYLTGVHPVYSVTADLVVLLKREVSQKLF